MKKLFGTDGVRGIANQLPMTGEVAMELGRATAYLFCEKDITGIHLRKPPKVVIGKDTRRSGYLFENALSAGFCSMGAQVFLLGPMPTPGTAFITRSMRADIGVIISASHNPFHYNGIKIFDKNGFKIADHKEDQIESLLNTKELDNCRPIMGDVGRAMRIDDANGRYIVYAKDSFPQDLTLEGIRIVLDCANGAAYKVAPIIFQELGAEVFEINCSPDGKNINDNCGAVHPEAMCRAVRDHRADIGIALDGDADRCILSDERGEKLDGDQIMAICGLSLLKEGKLKKNTMVVTAMSNMGLQLAIKEAGGKILEAKVGDRYIVETMLKNGLNFGGEQAGHIVFLEHNTTGDGILTSLKTLEIMLKSGKQLSELRNQMHAFPQVLENVPVRDKRDFVEYPKIMDSINRVKEALGNRGRVLVRYSGTEPLARVMVEGEDYKLIKSYADEIAHSIRSHLG